MAKKKNKKEVTRGNFILQNGERYYKETLWRSSLIVYTEIKRNARIFERKDFAQDVSDHIFRKTNIRYSIVEVL